MQISKSVLLAALAATPSLVSAMFPIHIKNYRFIKPSSATNSESDNEIFFVKGVDYQPGGSSGYDAGSDTDILSDPEICARDAYAFQQLGVNTVRIYSLNPDLNHDKCMTIFNDAGIYAILDVNSGNYGESLNRADPSGTYDSLYLSRVFKFIDAFKDYPNMLGFFSGNEVINDQSDYAKIDPPYIRAVQRDMKQYIAKHANRSIPVGYSAADNTDLRLATFKYLQCNSLDGNKVNDNLDISRSDFFGLNTYEWCSGISDWQSSGYDKLNSTFEDAVIPLIFSEYGCNTKTPRTFDEVSEGLYGGLKGVFSGGLVYEYTEEANNFGLVKVDDSGSLTYKDDFANLESQLQNISLPATKESELSSDSIYKCDSSDIAKIYSGFGTNNFTLPSQPAEIANMINYGVNGTNTGKILTDYAVPTTFNYTVKNNKGDTVSATIFYDKANALNKLDATTTAVANAVSTSQSSSHSVNSSSSASSSVGSSTSSSSKSKGAANVVNVPIDQSGYLALFAGLISALL
ncbi:putative 1,3-beta-glucanosyltransferase SKDI_13G3450 [Saccharomyces kudriavzevii IFO 1802]|uniref:1,3-beta-glucanosyltransferase n=2 Tax=Saccharomyces kudriavzevii (strain ATCC MYA-4449 / AS 2.2408 / CBS 8840 / NBRC 1802 / NCYC 2889) TaxID=226230 RepID=J6EHB4_SACK1|nr:uncharacterized protein SKDI_13G3450 [Saccharomyces kudriavzevii IFO 1802]EJT42802.1 GAS3-like protein [Saccharomyces kudriavzevii IFO 1802]CAI4048697.1 hypothetical protein SKDI_13G3450 [Saccharomyces kudriavzevii IFO 1802]